MIFDKNNRDLNITIVNKHRADCLGGSEIQCDFIAGELAGRGYNVNYVAVDGSQKPYGTSYKVIPCENESSDIADKIAETVPDIVYWRFNKNYFYDNVKKLEDRDCKVIFAASSAYDVNWFLYKKNLTLKKNIRRFFRSTKEQWGMKYVDAVVVNNKNYLHKLPVKTQEYIPNGMTEESVKFNWSKPYCAWIANIKKIKRPELFIELSSQFEKDGIDFIMVGHIQDEEYQWINDRSNVPENLYYLGPKTLEEVNGILKGSLFHVHTCLAEGFPNVFIQAWIQGKPSVTYGFDPANYIIDKELGYTAHEDSGMFVSYVKQLIEDPVKRDELGANAKKFAREMFQIEKSVTKLEKVFAEVLQQDD